MHWSTTSWTNKIWYYYNINKMVCKKHMKKEKTPTEKLHDDIRKMKKSERKTDDEIVRIYRDENDDAG